jgi:hypothetical protein
MAVRQEGVMCVQLVLRLAELYEGYVAERDNDFASGLSQIRDKILTEDPNELFEVTNELGKVRKLSVIPNKPTHYQLW